MSRVYGVKGRGQMHISSVEIAWGYKWDIWLLFQISRVENKH